MTDPTQMASPGGNMNGTSRFTAVHCALLLSAISTAVIAAEPTLRPIAAPLGAPVSGPPAPVFQKCAGPATFVAPNATFNLTCPVSSPVGGDKLFVLPEMWIPGNGCIATVDKPRVIMVGNSFSVTANFTNRCGSPYKGSEGGLGWFIYQVQ
jgi:hypothetical protein